VGTGNSADNALLVFGATQDLCVKGIDAVKLIKEVAPEIGGSGGGRRDFAQAGGNRPQNLESALNKLKGLISQLKL
jgi:alanyl-tRNA synthetase